MNRNAAYASLAVALIAGALIAAQSQAQLTPTQRPMRLLVANEGPLTLVERGSFLIRYSETTGKTEYFQIQPKDSGVGYVWKAFVDADAPAERGAERYQVSTAPSEFANFVRIDRTSGATWIASAVKGPNGSIAEMRWELAKP